MSADARSDVQALDATPGSGGRGRSLMRATLSLLLGVAMLAAMAPLAGALPPGRGYEKLSPADKDGQDILQGFDKAAVDGNASSYVSFGAFGDSEGGGLITQFVSTRGATDWLTESVSPTLVTSAGLGASLFNDLSDDLDTTIFSYAAGDPAFDGNTPGTANLYRRNPDGSIDTLSFGQPTPPPGTQTPTAPTYAGASADLSIVGYNFSVDPPMPVTEGPASTPGVTNAYASTGNRDVELVSVLPNGTASPTGGFVGSPNFTPGYNTVSDDGSRIFWSSGDAEVYVRTDLSSTEHASESQRGAPDPNGVQPKTYQYATPDGRFVYFTGGEKLTNNSQAEPSAPDLYRYDVDSGNLVDLTTGDPDGAGVQGVIGVSDNGGRVYFAANGQLAPGAADPGLNLYVRDGATTTFITALDPGFGDTLNWALDSQKTGRVNPSGSTLLFSSRAPQLGYDNAGFMELYVYDLASDEFECISCRPNGAPATADVAILSPPGSSTFSGLSGYEHRNLSADGSTAFFNSVEPLVNGDTNGKFDAYMWDEGALHLVSSGQSPSNSSFADASVSGNDAFFLTREQLVGVDSDNSIDLYDARVGGGLASQNPPPPPPPCVGEECKPPLPPNVDPATPGSAAVTGTEPPGAGPDCSSFEQKATKTAAKAKQKKQKVKQLKKKGASKKKIKKAKQKSKQAKQAAKEAKQAANECQNA